MADFSLTCAQHEMYFKSLVGLDPNISHIGVYPKGRRLGATHGAAVAFISWMLEGKACLWGDTINSNIDRYFSRYFEPFLTQYKVPYHWSSVRKLLKVGSGFTDFRSADRPENWEGFGYNRVFLNEAGIILNNAYLFNNAVLPMLLDHKGSILIAAGTPKLTRGKGKIFKNLWDKVQAKEKGYFGKTYTTYDNPFLDHEQVDNLKMKIPSFEREQEIYGKFLIQAGAMVDMTWFQRYSSFPTKVNRVIQSWDTASKSGALNDPSVCTTWMETDQGSFLIDVYRERLKYPALKRNCVNLALKYQPNLILIEDKSSGTQLIQDLQADRAFKSYIEAINPVADKITRMSTASLSIEKGEIWLPESAEWLPCFESEMLGFPVSTHDDQVDSVSQYINWLNLNNYLWR